MVNIIPPRNQVFTADGLPTLRFYEFLRGLTNQAEATAGEIPQEFEIQAFDGEEILSELDDTDFTLGVDLDEIEGQAPELDPQFVLPPAEVVGITANYTTTGDQIVVCSNTTPITITLNPTPDDGEQVHIKRQGIGLVTVSGTVDGQATTDIIFQYDSPHLVFTLAANEWSLI